MKLFGDLLNLIRKNQHKLKNLFKDIFDYFFYIIFLLNKIFKISFNKLKSLNLKIILMYFLKKQI